MEKLIELLPAFLVGLVPSIITAIPSIISLIKNIKLKKAQEMIDASIKTFEFGLLSVVSKLETIEETYKNKAEFTISEAMDVLTEMNAYAKQTIDELKTDFGHRLDVIESEMNKDVDEVHE